MKTRYCIAFVYVLSILTLCGNITRGQCPAVTRLYVNKNVTGGSVDGTTWANAYSSLGEAMWKASQCVDITELWVAAGTYLPTRDQTGVSSPVDPRDKVFYIKSGLKIYGGFAGTETTLVQRITMNVTILSGDFNNNDVVSGTGGTLSITANTENAYHVLIAQTPGTTTVIDAITIRGGNGNGTGLKNRGGGIFNTTSSPIMTNCIFTGNAATQGGGMYNTTSSAPRLTNCVFSNNYAFGSGTSTGGAIYNSSSPVVLTNCIIRGNRATLNAGGMFHTTTPFTMTNCVFDGNNASNGGGLFVSGVTATIVNCSFNANTSTIGGGVYASTNTLNVPNLINCTFTGNIAVTGAGMYVTNGPSTLINCTFNGNTGSTPAAQGAGITYESGGSSTITNCIFWNNTTPNNASDANREEIYSTNAVSISYSTIRDYNASASINITFGSGITTNNPLFVNAADPNGADNIFGTADDGLVPGNCSPAQNAGLNSVVPVTVTSDIKGDDRILQATVDVGAYEAATPVTIPSTLALAGSSMSTTTVLGLGNAYFAISCAADLIAGVRPGGASALSGSTTASVFIQGTAPEYESHRYVRRHYDIAPAANANTATATIILYFTQADFDDYNLNNGTDPDLPTGSSDVAGIANLKITQQHGTSATGVPGSYSGWSGDGPAVIILDPADNNVVWNSTTGRWQVSCAVTGFSGFFVSGILTQTLPVKLIDFKAQKTSSKFNRLDWHTSIESAGTLFEVTRSYNGVDFSKLGIMSGKGDNASYIFYDEQPFAGSNYYRLKMTGTDGELTYSNVTLVKNNNNGATVTVAPVPASNIVTISNADPAFIGKAMIISDMQGRVVHRFTMEAVSRINISKWASGLYSLRLPDGVVVRIVKQ